MNVRSFVLGAQRAVDLMGEEGGRIVTLSSYGSIRAYPTYANLGAAKAALEAYVRYMAIEFAPLGINVNAVNGGIIESDSSAYFYGVDGMPGLDVVLPKSDSAITDLDTAIDLTAVHRLTELLVQQDLAALDVFLRRNTPNWGGGRFGAPAAGADAQSAAPVLPPCPGARRRQRAFRIASTSMLAYSPGSL